MYAVVYPKTKALAPLVNSKAFFLSPPKIKGYKKLQRGTCGETDMIKIFSGIYIHFLTVVLFVFCFITRKAQTLAITYIIMTVHECAHLLAALLIGLKPERMVFYPFGVNLKLKNRLLPSMADEFILYIAGPMANIVMALSAKIFLKDFSWQEDFYIKNILLFAINMLPILPLDGGIILKRAMSYVWGEKTTVRFMRVISSAMIISAGVFLWYENILCRNFSLFFFFVFLLGNLFTAKEKYNVDLLRGLMFSKRKVRCAKARVVVMANDENLRNVLKEFTNTHYNILCVIGENGEIEKIMSEREVIKALTSN